MKLRGVENALMAAVTTTLIPVALSGIAAAQQTPSAVDDAGAVKLPSVSVPYSDLASPEARRNFIEYVRVWGRFRSTPDKDPSIQKKRERIDREIMIPGLERLRAAFAVDINPEKIGGVQTDVVVPAMGVAPVNKHRVLINLHGGGMQLAARYGGQMESVPIASLAGIKVITVDYRMAPEAQFPAASEDVAKVYRELLKTYRAKNIGIYGCSAGAALTAQAVAWFQAHGLPRPGAIGMFGYAADLGDLWGDSNYVSSALEGGPMPHAAPGRKPSRLDYGGQADLDDPLFNPATSAAVLSAFPPSLLLSGTRDMALSKVLSTHARLVDLGVEADLHVWDGLWHCSFAQTVVDPDVPEHRQAWKVISRFFDKHLSKAQ